jgi:hypothetical protein
VGGEETMTSTFTVLIGSIGRPSLKHSLDSIARQHRMPEDRVIISVDTFEDYDGARLRSVRELVEQYQEPNFIVTDFDAGYHWLGVEQINHAIRKFPLSTSHVFTIGDDDVFLDNAYTLLRPFCDAQPYCPILYRFIAPNRWMLWDAPRMRACLISGCCIAAPSIFTDLMHTRIETTHDYDWMMDIIGRAKTAGYDPVWLDYVGVVARPQSTTDGNVIHGPIGRCWHCNAYWHSETFRISQTHCHLCGVVVDLNTTWRPRIVAAVDENTQPVIPR